MDYADVIIIGTGDLGAWLVEFLARAPGMEHKKILIGDVNEETARKRTFSAWDGISYLDQFPEMEFTKIDLFNVDETGELLKKYKERSFQELLDDHIIQKLFVTVLHFSLGGLWTNFLRIFGLKWKQRRV